MITVRREVITPALLCELREHGLLTSTPPDDFDLLFVARLRGAPIGVQCLRPLMYAHSLELSPAPTARRAADALYLYSEGFVKHARDHSPPGVLAIAGTLFHCLRDNDKVRRYMEDRGAIPLEPDAVIYRYEP